MNFFKKIKFILILTLPLNNAFTETPYYIDFKYILNQSEAGKKAQTELKNKLKNGIDSLSKREKGLQEEEKKIIGQKKIISEQEYIKNVTNLRKKVSKLQKDRNQLLENI